MQIPIFAVTGLITGWLLGALLQKEHWGYSLQDVRWWIAPDFRVLRFSILIPFLGMAMGILTGLMPFYSTGRFRTHHIGLMAIAAFLIQLYYFVTLSAIIITSILDEMWVPVILVYPGIICGLGGSLILPGFVDPVGLKYVPRSIDAFLNSLAGAAVSYGLYAAIRWIYFQIRQVDLTLGVASVAAMIGSYVGYKKAMFAILATSVLGSVAGIIWLQLKSTWRSFRWLYRHQEIPHSMFKAIVGLLTPYIAGPVLNWYMMVYKLHH
jgi:prepilin signal peptidase PulO-like enzyme (type II secretory pathway)